MAETKFSEFVQQIGRVIITDSVKDINRMLRSLNRFNGLKMADCRVMSVTQAAMELYQAYCAYDQQEKCFKLADIGLCKALFYSLLLCVSVPPEMSISNFMGYLKGKSVLMLYDKHPELESKWNKSLWARGYYVAPLAI